jgi:hypothetical protein
MKLQNLKKIYLKKKVINLMKFNKITIFLQITNISLKQELILRKKIKILNFNIFHIKNKSTFLKKNNFKLATVGKTYIIHSVDMIKLNDNQNLSNFIALICLLKQFNLNIIGTLYNKKIYTNYYFKKLSFYKSNLNLFFNLFNNFKNISNPNVNLQIKH